MKKLVELLRKIFSDDSYQMRLDQYISKYHPKSTAEIEMLVREFDRKVARGII